MKFQVASDLHLEDYIDPKSVWKYLIPTSDTLIVAGDINARMFEASVVELSRKFQDVIVVMGNHDYTDRDLSWTPTVPKNVHLLNPGVVELDDTVFIGATLWSDLKSGDWFVKNAAKSMVCDFDDINEWTVDKMLTAHDKDKAYIKMMIEKYSERKIVIVTHFVPSYALLHKYWKSNGGLLNWYFSANCDDIINRLNDEAVWVYGHTHNFGMTDINGTRFFCNPIGKNPQLSKYRNFQILN